MSLRSTVQLARARAGLEPSAAISLLEPDRPVFEAAGGSQAYSSRQWYEPVEALAACLRHHGIRSGDRILLLAETRMEWFQADLALAAAGALSVPVYPTLPARQIEEILVDSGARAAVIANPVLLEELLRAPSSPQLRVCVLMPSLGSSAEGGAGGSLPPGRRAGNLLGWEEAIALGREASAETISRVEAIVRGQGVNDPVTLIYTSGTSGRMKGVVLTHGNLLASAVSSAQRLRVGPEDVYLSFLPLTHVLERVVHLSMLWAGARLHYSSGLDQLEADLHRARPTILVGVPRFYEKLVRSAAERARARGSRGHLLFVMAERAALRAGRRGPGSRPRGLSGWYWDLLVYRRIRKALGGRTRLLISGGAPLGARELLFLSGCGLNVVEGYGLTETASVVTVNTPDEFRRGSVGRALPGIELRLAEDGEVLIRGPSVMPGYWQDEAATREVLRDGWLYTGDLGRIDRDGFLFITGRKKDLIVTAHGKKVAPQMVETLLRRCPLVHEAVVTGDRRPFLVALIYPDLDVLRARLGLALPDGPELGRTLEADGVRALYRMEIDRACAGLAPHETVRDFVLLPERPGVADGSLTPTLKLRRGEVERRYSDRIKRLYELHHA